MATILILFAVFCTGRGVQSLMEFPALSYKGPAATGAGVGSPAIGLTLHGPVLDMESLASHAEGALETLSNSMGITFPRSKTKTDRISAAQTRPAAWISQRVEAKPTLSLQPPCSHRSSDQHLPSHKLPESSSKVDLNKPSSNIALSLIPIPSKADISTNQQHISLPPKADISANHQDISLPVKELNSNHTSNVQVNSYLIPAFSHPQSVYAVNENHENPIVATSASFGANHHNSISPFYKEPQVFSHTSDTHLPLQLSGPSYPAYGVSSIVNPSPHYIPTAASPSSNTLSSSYSPKADLPITSGIVVPPVPLPHMIYAVQNHSEIPLTETQVKLNSYYPNQQLPPYTYFPFRSFCHHSKSNLPPFSGSVLPRPFSVNYQPPQHLTPAVPYYAATPQTHAEISYMPQRQQDYYYPQNEAAHHGASAPVNVHTFYNQ